MMKPASLPSSRALALTGFLALLAPRVARAEDSVAYKYSDYREMGGRIAVQTQGAYLEKDLGPDSRVKLEGILDAIAGATPTGQPAPAGSDQVPVSELDERRKAWNADFSHQFPRVALDFGFGNSRESDYVSNGWSVNTVADYNEKNTTVTFGIAGTDDKIKVYYSSVAPRARKHTNDFIAGVTQLLDPQTSVTLDLGWGRQHGYLSDPYKLVQKSVEIFPGVSLPLTFGENRPDERKKWTVLAGVNRAFPELRGAIDASYRFYHDTYGTDAHTVDIAWFQRLRERLILRPSFRFYDQTAAKFYHYDLDRTDVVPVAGAPRPQGPFYSSDFRLSAMQTFTYGVKFIWNLTEALALDAAFERYEMRGTDGVTPQSAYARANILTGGLKFSW